MSTQTHSSPLDCELPMRALSQENYAFLQEYVQNQTGIVLEKDKRYLVESRLLPILRERNLVSLDSLCQELATKTSFTLGKRVIEAMTTNETLFFRDPAMFEALRVHILPSLLKQVNADRKLRIWSAAASTGQEAYSLAMLLREMEISEDRVEIIGTDISERVVERARAARYIHFEVNRGLPISYLEKYFDRADLDWQLKDCIRKMVHFSTLDLRQNMTAMAPCDLVLCRNVLIYFNSETKKQVLGAIKRILGTNGVLTLGSAETLIRLDRDFRRKVIGLSAFYTL
jgi:chemotaxis protein methyltransferase CheR